MTMKLALAILLAISSAAAAEERPAIQLRQAIIEEEVNQKLDKAIDAYTKILAHHDEDRKVAATALFHLAECNRKLGRKEKAVDAYQRVLREFADQAALSNASRNTLTQAYGISAGQAPAAQSPEEQDRLVMQRALADEERSMQRALENVGKQLREARERMTETHPEVMRLKYEIEEMKKALEALILQRNMLADQNKK
jgi:tetratricopeptide (TPR) repeat protein